MTATERILNMHDFELGAVDTDCAYFYKKDGSAFTPEERVALQDEFNSIMLEHIKVSIDGYAPAMVVLKTKNRIYTNEKGDVKVKGSALKSSKMLPAIKKFHKRITDGLLGITDESLPDIYHNEVLKLCHGVNSIQDWASKKTISEKTIRSERKTERDIMEAVKGVHWQNGDKIWVYRTNEDKLKLVDSYSSDAPDYNLRKLLSSLANSAKVFDTVVDPSYRKDYGKPTNTRSLNDMARAKILPEKVKKPSVKNSLAEILNLITQEGVKIAFPDQYGQQRFEEFREIANMLLKPKPKPFKDPNAPKKTRKKKEVEVASDELF